MALKQQLQIRQSPSLTMTPQMQMAVKLLQLNNLELKELLDQELEQNPLLEVDTEDAKAPQETKSNEELDFDQSPSKESLDEAESSTYENVWQEGTRGETSQTAFGDDKTSFEDFTASEPSLQERLFEQFSHEVAGSPPLSAIGYDLIHNLTEAGYMEASLEEVAARMGVEVELVEEALEILQDIAPPGVGARNLSECLALQLMHRGTLSPQKQLLLDNLHLVAARNLNELTRLTGLAQTDLMAAIQEIRTLDPRPGHDLDAPPPQTLVPDVIVGRNSRGWTVALNSETLPRALANETYYREVRAQARSQEDKDYLSKKWSEASWLLKAMDQRAQTILKVAEALIQQQGDFLEYGIKYLKPLILKDIAQKIDMHESTISRVTTNKYMATPRGIFELRFFFTTAISSNTGGEAHSSSYIRERIKELIRDEPSQKPLSDDKLVDLLAKDGVELARRTVTKYREGMNIPSSFERRRLKSI